MCKLQVEAFYSESLKKVTEEFKENISSKESKFMEAWKLRALKEESLKDLLEFVEDVSTNESFMQQLWTINGTYFAISVLNQLKLLQKLIQPDIDSKSLSRMYVDAKRCLPFYCIFVSLESSCGMYLRTCTLHFCIVSCGVTINKLVIVGKDEGRSGHGSENAEICTVSDQPSDDLEAASGYVEFERQGVCFAAKNAWATSEAQEG